MGTAEIGQRAKRKETSYMEDMRFWLRLSGNGVLRSYIIMSLFSFSEVRSGMSYSVTTFSSTECHLLIAGVKAGSNT